VRHFLEGFFVERLSRRARPILIVRLKGCP
jgi:hypothetical protein